MSVTALQLNWPGVEFASTNLTSITSAMFAQGGQLLPFFGDNKYPRGHRDPERLPQVLNHLERCRDRHGDRAGTGGTIVATQVDALNYQFGRRHF